MSYGTPRLTPTRVHQAPGAAPAAMAEVQLVNATGGELCHLFISSSAIDSWGDDLLAGQTVPAGATVVLELDTAEPSWDLMAQDCGGNPLAEDRNHRLTADGVWTLAGAGPPRGGQPYVPVPVQPSYGGSVVQVANATGYEICYLYISVAGDEWGPDRLGDTQTLPVGATAVIPLGGGNGLWDLKAETCSRETLADVRSVPIPPDGVWTVYATEPPASGGYAVTPGGYEEPVGPGRGLSGGSYSGGSGNTRVNRAHLVAAAWFLGVSGGDLSDALRGDCGFVDNSDLQDFCRGDCGFIDNSDVQDLCRGDCGFIDSSDLQDFCRDDCGFIDDSDLQDLCRGDCGFIDNSTLSSACRDL